LDELILMNLYTVVDYNLRIYIEEG